MELAKKSISTVVPLHTSPIKRILGDLSTGKADAFCGAGRNDKREKEYIYSIRPVYDVSNVVVMHQDDLFEPQSFSDIRKFGVEVGSYFGASSTEYLKLQTGVRVNDSFTDLIAALRMVATTNRVRMFFYHDLGLVYMVRKSKLPLRIARTKFRTFSHWILYSRKTDPDLILEIEDALLKIELSGKLKEIQQRYTAAD